MLLLILKSSACLAIFMLFYKLFLEKESIHHFKRFYLLGALVVSIVIPFITFTQYIEVEPIQDFISFQPLEFSNTEVFTPEVTTWQDYIPIVLWSIYLLGVALFSFRFVLNLRAIFYRIKTNPKHQYHEFTNVLLQDLIHPHTFFKYIFLNKTKYEHNLIPNEVMLHEQTHAKQKHALDILCIEVLQIIFWFNPLLYFIKKDIKLNHEFLADQAVLQKGIDSAQYKQTLLAFSSNAKESQLVNAINYSLIKKRFTVMKSKTSKKAFWLRSIVLLPMLAILIYSFSSKEIVKVEKEINSNNNNIKIYIDKKRNTELNGKQISFNSLTSELKNSIDGFNSKELSNTKVFIEIEGEVTLNLLKDIKDQIAKTGLIVYEVKANFIEIDEKEFEENYKQTNLFFKGTQFTGEALIFKNKKGEKIKGKSFKKHGNNIESEKIKITPQGVKEYDSITIRIPRSKNYIVNSDDLNRISKYVDSLTTPAQQKATPEEIEEYNTICKKLNALPETKKIIKQKNIYRIAYIHDKMTQDQESNAEPFPTVVPPPPLPPYPVEPKHSSSVLLELKKSYDEKANTYHKAAKLYRKEKKGKISTLILLSQEALKTRKAYVELAKKRIYRSSTSSSTCNEKFG